MRIVGSCEDPLRADDHRAAEWLCVFVQQRCKRIGIVDCISAVDDAIQYGQAAAGRGQIVLVQQQAKVAKVQLDGGGGEVKEGWRWNLGKISKGSVAFVQLLTQRCLSSPSDRKTTKRQRG